MSKTIKKHMRQVHGLKIPMFSCRYCLDGLDHGSYKALYHHMKIAHNYRSNKVGVAHSWFKAFECDACGYAFKTAANLFDHLLFDHCFLDIDLRRCKTCDWTSS